MRCGFLLMGCLGVIVDDSARRAFIAWWRDAIRMAGFTEQQACQEAGVDQAAWSHMCAANKHLSGEALAQMPDNVKRWVSLITLIELGLPEEVVKAVHIETAVASVKRMARATLRTADGKERVA